MVAFNFRPRFVPDIEAGIKRQTMRDGDQRAWPGDQLQLYTGQRTKKCRKIKDAICIHVSKVILEPDNMAIEGLFTNCSIIGLENFAVQDGFKNWAELRKFFFGKKNSSKRRELWLYVWDAA